MACFDAVASAPLPIKLTWSIVSAPLIIMFQNVYTRCYEAQLYSCWYGVQTSWLQLISKLSCNKHDHQFKISTQNDFSQYAWLMVHHIHGILLLMTPRKLAGLPCSENSCGSLSFFYRKTLKQYYTHCRHYFHHTTSIARHRLTREQESHAA